MKACRRKETTAELLHFFQGKKSVPGESDVVVHVNLALVLATSSVLFWLLRSVGARLSLAPEQC